MQSSLVSHCCSAFCEIEYGDASSSNLVIPSLLPSYFGFSSTNEIDADNNANEPPSPSCDPDTTFLILSDSQKGSVLSAHLSHKITVDQLRVLAHQHSHVRTLSNRVRKNKAALLTSLHEHVCTNLCLISLADALSANLFVDALHLSQDVVSSSMAHLNILRTRDIPPRHIISNVSIPAVLSSTPPVSPLTAHSWPQCTPFHLKKKLIAEFNEFTSNNSLSCEACSFCGTNELSSQIHRYEIPSLDISLLESVVNQLKEITSVASIQVFNPATISDSFYKVCHLCKSNITRSKFKTVPLYSYANNCWLGPVPEELVGLSYLEEQCIARARSTRCVIKLKKGESGQFASKGNVCIFPQEPKILMSVLPPPINVLHDEIAVVFVSSADNPVTAEILEKSPLLVRRHRILRALEWLKQNNPLYKDIRIDYETLNCDYPTDGAALGFATTEVLNNSSANSEGTSYAHYASESNDAAFADKNPIIPMTSSGMLDTDQVTSTYKM